MNEEIRKVRNELTGRHGSGDNGETSCCNAADARFVAIVRFLARRVAERDYAQLIERLGAGDAAGDDLEGVQ